MFIGLVWLREQILHGGGPEWLEHVEEVEPPPAPQPQQQHQHVPAAQQPQERAADDDQANPEFNNNNNENVDNELHNANNVDAQPDLPRAEVEDNNQNQFWGPRVDPVEAAANINNADRDLLVEPVVDEPNWNPIEWDRAAEELTWERLLGLDGSMLFLEHVFWVVSLNTIFIFIFAFCPYVIGNFCITGIGLLRAGQPAMHVHGLLTTLIGYFVIAIILIKLHAFAAFFSFNRTRRILGLCYIFIKVSLLSVVEIGLLPLICGWWLDICSLPMFDATLKERKLSFKSAPGTSLFIHWMFGMVYVYYFASFIVLLREVLRPGVLWFLRNLNDPEFSPIQVSCEITVTDQEIQLANFDLHFFFSFTGNDTFVDFPAHQTTARIGHYIRNISIAVVLVSGEDSEGVLALIFAIFGVQ